LSRLVTRILLSLCLLGFYQQAVFAQPSEASQITEEDYIGDVPRVLTVSRLSQSVADAPSAVTVIDRELIRASGIVDLPEIFRLVPGFYVGTDAGFIQNTNHVVSYHGMTSAYAGSMQVLINGRSVYSPLYGGVQWSELPIAVADIERIEVTRGPNAASYGANSYFGVINIITQHPSTLPANTVITSLGEGRVEAFYRHAGKMENFDYRVTAGYREDEGVDNRHDFKRTDILNAQADYRIDNQNNLEFEFGLADGGREEGDLRKDNKIFLPRTKPINNHYELVRWRRNLSEDSDFSLQAYHMFDRSDDVATSANLRPILGALGSQLLNNTITINNPVETRRFDVEAQHNFAIGKDWRVVWGGSVRRDSMYAPHYLGTEDTDYFDLQRLFGHVEWRAADRLTANAGAMLEHNDFTGTDISPRGSVNFKLTPQQTFRLGISSALRTPNYLEEKFDRKLILPTISASPYRGLFFQYAADRGNLKPEKIVSREIGYLGQFGPLSLDGKLYRDTIFDQIHQVSRTDYLVPTGMLNISNTVNTFVNDGSADVTGFELQAKLNLNENTRVLLNYADENIRQRTTGLKGEFVNSAPGNTVSALLSHRFDEYWDGSLAYYQVGNVEALGDGQPVPLTRRIDLRLARKLILSGKHAELSAVVQNLLNHHYYEFAQYNLLDRRAWVNFKMDY
jgi:iron complex outermembrane recepter protein